MDRRREQAGGTGLAIPRPSRFQLFLLVSGVLIATIVTVSGLSVGRFFEAHVLTDEDEDTVKVVRSQARLHLSPAQFASPPSEEQNRLFQRFFDGLPSIFKIDVFDPTGRIVWSNDSRLIGRVFPAEALVARALGGEVVTALDEEPQQSEHVFEETRRWVARAYVPISFAGRPGVAGVVKAYKEMTPLVQAIRRTQRIVWSVAAGLGALLYLFMALVVWKATVNERRAIRRLEAQNRELTLIQQFTRSVLEPLDLAEVSASMVESAGVRLRLAAAGFYRVQAGRPLVLLAGWPSGAPLASPPEDLAAEAVETRTQIIRDADVALPVLTHKGTEHLFLARFRHPVSEADLPAVRTLEIMLDEASIVLANVELFTDIREAHERLAAILAGITDRMLIVDRAMGVVWMNSVAAEAHGSERSILGRRCYEALGADGEACENCPAVRTFGTGRVARGVRAERLPDGSARYFDLVAAPLHDPSGQVHQVLEVARDITGLVEMEERLKQFMARLEESHAELFAKAEELERANGALREAQAQLVEKERLAAVGEVVVGLHDAILNPLTGILGALQVLKREESVRPGMMELVAEAEAESRKIEQLVRRLPSLRRTTGTPYVGGTTMLDLERSCAEEQT